MAAGILFVSLGATGLIMGTAIDLGATRDCTTFRDFGPGGGPVAPTDCSDHTGQVVGMSILIASAALIGGGIPLWIYGSDRVPKLERQQEARARPALLIGPGAAGLRWSF